MNIQSMMAQAKKMQSEMEKAKKELASQEFTVEKQGIKVVLTGDKRVKIIDINEILIDPEDKDIIEGLIIVAINEGLEKIEEAEAESMPNTQGMPF